MPSSLLQLCTCCGGRPGSPGAWLPTRHVHPLSRVALSSGSRGVWPKGDS